MKTPSSFAKLYVNGEINLPVMSSISASLEIYESNYMAAFPKFKEALGADINDRVKQLDNIKALNKSNLSPKTKAEILKALYELTQAIFSRQGHLKTLNKEITKKRQDTIKHLKKTLDYPFLPYKDTIQKALDMLMELNDPKTYHPIKEIDFIKTAVIDRPLLGDITGSFHAERNKKLYEMLSRPLKFKEGRPSDFFYKALQAVVYEYLIKAETPKQKAKQQAADIINEYLKKNGHKKLAILTDVNIDNAVHHS